MFFSVDAITRRRAKSAHELESGSLYQARRGEVPGGVIERFPPPGDLPGAESEQQVDEGPA
jgi:hypothetical protein